MKKKVLFVDDEPFVLEGLQRMLRSMREEWEMTFVESGAEALKLMAQTRIDIIVTDMRMPGMNGAELLNIVMQRYPQTIRLILSGHADKNLILRCVGSTHQYLSKPCAAEDLKLTVARAARTESSLKNEGMRSLLGRMSTVPSIPTLYSEIVAQTQDLNVDLADVAETISKDIGMTASVLKLVNSAFFGLNRQINNTQEAVSYLGIDTIKSLVLSLTVFSQMSAAPLGGLDINRLWAHSLSVAQLAKQIARDITGDCKLAQEAFAGGVLHDCGKLILAMNFPKQYKSLLTRMKQGEVSLLEAERREFGTDHAVVGSYLLGLWGLPVPVVEVIAFHHDPDISDTAGLTPLKAVYIANMLVNESDASTRPEASTLNEYVQRLGFASRLAAWRETLCNPVLSL